MKTTNKVVSISTGTKPAAAKITKPKPVKRLPVEERFHSSYTKQPNGCWEWKATRGFFENGYSQFSDKNETLYGHRYSWMLANKQQIPSHLQCRHLCNNKRCVNPSHIAVGTALENANDRILAGTTNKGRTISTKRFTEAERARIAEMVIDNKTAYAIAKAIGRTQPGVSLYLKKHRAAIAGKIRAAAPDIIAACESLRDTLQSILDEAA